jgi:hypothetical protein
LAIGRAGAVNAALLAASILALGDPALSRRLQEWRAAQTAAVPDRAGMTAPLPPGSTIGILGGGQLGRMAALAAARLGYRCHVFAPEADSPACRSPAARTVAPMTTPAALAAFAAAVDVVTFEFENVPAATLDILAPLVPCRPGVAALRTAQDRVAEKRFFESAGIPVGPWREVTSIPALRDAVAALGLPAVLKTTRLGYDGRGQAVLRREEDLEPAFTRLSPHSLILEAFIPFEREGLRHRRPRRRRGAGDLRGDGEHPPRRHPRPLHRAGPSFPGRGRRRTRGGRAPGRVARLGRRPRA